MKISEKIISLLESYGEIFSGIDMAQFTSYKTGGAADLVVIPRTRASIPAIMTIASSEGLPVTVIGGGSNLLVGDMGIRGLVLAVKKPIDARPEIFLMDDGRVFAAASASKDEFISFCIGNGFGGVEFLAGIPGCIGGGIMMNAGTFLGSFSDILDEIEIVSGGIASIIPVSGGLYSYRHMEIPAGSVVSGGIFRLEKSENIDLVKQKIRDLLAERSRKHPLNYPSAGSVFKNPEGHHSWKLVNDAGLRGCRVGGAMVSDLHTNFIINSGGATPSDIKKLIEVVQKKVFEMTGIMLEPEVKMLGEFN